MEPLEDHEHPFRVLGIDADSVVGEGEAPEVLVRVRLAGQRYPRGPPRSTERDRVGDQVLQQHPQLGGVPVHGRQRVADQHGTGLGDAHAERVLGGGPDLFQVDRSVAVVDAAHPREREQVVDQGLHPVGAVDGEADVLVRLVVQLCAVAPLQELAEAGDLPQRLLQVVRGHIGELLQFVIGPREFGGVGVDRGLGGPAVGQFLDQVVAHGLGITGQLPQVGRAVAGDGVVEVTVGDRPEPRRQVLQWHVHASAQAGEDQHRKGQDDQRDGREQPVPQHPGALQLGDPGVSAVLQVLLLGGQRRPERVELPLALVDLRDVRRNRVSRGRADDGPGDVVLPGLRPRPHQVEVGADHRVSGRQQPQSREVSARLGLALGVRLEELGLSGDGVAPGTRLLVDQGRLQLHGVDQGRVGAIHQLVRDGSGVHEEPHGQRTEQDEHRQRRRGPGRQPAPGGPHPRAAVVRGFRRADQLCFQDRLLRLSRHCSPHSRTDGTLTGAAPGASAWRPPNGPSLPPL